MTIDAVALLVLILGVPVAAAGIVGTRILRGLLRSSAKDRWFEKKWLVRTSAVFLGIYALALAYAALIEPNWVEATRTEIRVRQPVLGKDRFRIAHLTDFHTPSMGRRERRVCDIVREARPDLVLMTGDYVKGGDGYQVLLDMFRTFGAPHGIYGVCGNNDDPSACLETFSWEGATILPDTKTILQKDGYRLCVAGRSEGSATSLESILDGVPADTITIFLSHKPDDADELGRLDPGQRVDLFLCGHTHGGQVCLPVWGAVVTESKYHKRYERGLYDVNGVPMYVNRGLGTTLLPLRFLSRPEVAIIDLVHR